MAADIHAKLEPNCCSYMLPQCLSAEGRNAMHCMHVLLHDIGIGFRVSPTSSSRYTHPPPAPSLNRLCSPDSL
jgi:hypothetical protein